MKQQVPEEKRALCIQAVRDGASMKEVSETAEICVETIRRWVNNPEPRKKTGVAAKERPVEEIRRALNAGWTLDRIGRELLGGVCRERARQILGKLGLRSARPYVRKTVL
jgi:transposase